MSLGRNPLDEILVGVRRVELYDLKVPAVAYALLGDGAGHVGLARARRPVENHLPLFLQVVNDLL